jgi:2'-5' RNA ligase
MSLIRSFISVDLDNHNFLEIQELIKKTKANIKFIEPKNIHITLKFLGDIEKSQIKQIEDTIYNSINGINSFKIDVKGLGVFPNKSYIKIIWAGIKNYQTLENTVNRIDENLSIVGFKKEKRDFSPHITIGRVKTAKNKKQLLEIIERYGDYNFGEFTVDSINLKKSELTPKGPIYSNISEIKLD